MYRAPSCRLSADVFTFSWVCDGASKRLSSHACRQMFANHRLAFAAAEMEVHEAKARLEAQNQLAAAQAQAAQRALVVAREKASNEAKSEFMSLMCHEVRTPLNGCLASAEMLLETVLQVRIGWNGKSCCFLQVMTPGPCQSMGVVKSAASSAAEFTPPQSRSLSWPGSGGDMLSGHSYSPQSSEAEP